MPIELVEVGNPPVVKPKIFVGIALDRSSSMESIRDSVISNYNEQVDDIINKAKDADLKLSLVSFASEIETHYLNSNVDSLVKLSRDSYRPNGMTAMHHAMGVLIDGIEKEVEGLDDYAVLLITVSDGDDNTPDPSGKFTKNFIRNKITSLQDGKRWTFVFIGATKDKILIEKDLGISARNISNFAVGDALSYGNSTRRTRSATANYLSGTMKCMAAAASGGNRFDECLVANADFFAGVPEDNDAVINNQQPPSGYTFNGDASNFGSILSAIANKLPEDNKKKSKSKKLV